MKVDQAKQEGSNVWSRAGGVCLKVWGHLQEPRASQSSRMSQDEASSGGQAQIVAHFLVLSSPIGHLHELFTKLMDT